MLRSGLSAGTVYPEVWIRDLNTFIEFALTVAEPKVFRAALINFLLLQGEDGDIVDGYVPASKQQELPYRTVAALPQYVAHKNTVTTDQESSLVLAVSKYVKCTGDESFLEVLVDGATVRERLRRSLEFPMAARFDSAHGLIWGGTTIDWGDVAPERLPGTRLFPETHRAIGVYHNALLLSAISAYVHLPGTTEAERTRWKAVYAHIEENIRTHLWDSQRDQYRPHIYLSGSPFPATFDESHLYMHGGTTVAMEAGLLTPEQVGASLHRMRGNVRAARASSIGLTLYPPYPEYLYADPILSRPYKYQNGGDWCWFGGRTVQQLIRFGMLEAAYEELKPMAARVTRVGDFYEWWTPDNQPRGSAKFRGGAGVLGLAIQQLRAAAASG